MLKMPREASKCNPPVRKNLWKGKSSWRIPMRAPRNIFKKRLFYWMWRERNNPFNIPPKEPKDQQARVRFLQTVRLVTLQWEQAKAPQCVFRIKTLGLKPLRINLFSPVSLDTMLCRRGSLLPWWACHSWPLLLISCLYLSLATSALGRSCFFHGWSWVNSSKMATEY